ncbi:alpha/beta hydrolase [Halobiforma lacisalsi AJ5]|uniref:Alpha/beta hydrolase n=1 Tax=Natronobacterium lacisalsi AJ5 TaxID=358396 RepID=M0LP09_NATLA|nr:hypothetical protein [Halobiforma lacisalsi]APW99334.1 alpha/beta hydrolase [Halobiforma lacisalsi AJ5]EMA35236.1 alpha/beta hydrolase fold protein [Halobiforma lacisalsi AJ5]
MNERLPEDWVDDDVRVNGVRIRYLRTGGSSRPLVVAHGLYDDVPS